MKIASSSSKEPKNNDDEEDVSTWMTGQLKFTRGPSEKANLVLSYESLSPI